VSDDRDWVAARYPGSLDALDRFAALVTAENARQNLVAPSTVPAIWSRHIVDSLQLVDHAPAGPWLDIGTGGGFPGLAVAIVRREPTLLVEPRRKRAEFLAAAARELGLDHVAVHTAKVESVQAKGAVVSARAVASIEALVQAARHVATRDTVWLLPRGRFDPAELEPLRKHQPVFHVKQSVTDPASSILILSGIGAEGPGK
jgi:16S rRNA (guanine527-N7)-methyltransferase